MCRLPDLPKKNYLRKNVLFKKLKSGLIKPKRNDKRKKRD